MESPTKLLWAAVSCLVLTLACAPAPRVAQHPGAELYQDLGCARCHGDALQGTRTAPPLHEMGSFWSEEELVAFLENPASVTRSSPRLQRLGQSYPVAMGPVDATRDDLRILSEYLLAP
jgi:hypothetical protein